MGRIISSNGRYKKVQSSKNLFHKKNNRNSGMAHGGDFVVIGPAARLIEPKHKLAGVCPVKTRIISHLPTESIKAMITRVHWERSDSESSTTDDVRIEHSEFVDPWQSSRYSSSCWFGKRVKRLKKPWIKSIRRSTG